MWPLMNNLTFFQRQKNRTIKPRKILLKT